MTVLDRASAAVDALRGRPVHSGGGIFIPNAELVKALRGVPTPRPPARPFVTERHIRGGLRCSNCSTELAFFAEPNCCEDPVLELRDRRR